MTVLTLLYTPCCSCFVQFLAKCLVSLQCILQKPITRQKDEKLLMAKYLARLQTKRLIISIITHAGTAMSLKFEVFF